MHPNGIPVDMTVDRSKFERPCPQCGETLHMRTSEAGNAWMHVRHDAVRHREDVQAECFPPPEAPAVQEYNLMLVKVPAGNMPVKVCAGCGSLVLLPENHDAFHRSLT